MSPHLHVVHIHRVHMKPRGCTPFFFAPNSSGTEALGLAIRLMRTKVVGERLTSVEAKVSSKGLGSCLELQPPHLLSFSLASFSGSRKTRGQLGWVKISGGCSQFTAPPTHF